MAQEGDHNYDKAGAPQPFFSGGEGDPTASYGSQRLGPGAQIGRYKLLGILGEGGYGIVYLAQQERPIKRRVALKIVKPGMDSKQVIARFEAERQALALLDHPNLAHIYDAGTTQAGRPYFAMEYIEGLPITEYCDREKLDIRQRLSLFQQVCRAVQYAHQKGIIHRDLKPSNILVAAKDEEPLVKVIDFGIAKALAEPLTSKTLYTEQGQFIGTPDYMSPEQAEIDAQGVDMRSDVYSLGVVLYELLTGVLPFDPEELRTGGLAHIQAVLRDQEPRTPSTRLTGLGEQAQKIAERRGTDPKTLARSLHKELEWIPLKAMRKERSRRYQSASDFAGDVENYLKGIPLLAGPESVAYRGKKFVQRHIGAVAAIAVIVTLLLIGFVVSTTMYFKAERMRVIADESREVAETSQAAEAAQRQAAEQERNRALAAESEARALLAESYEQQGRHYLESGRLDEALLYLVEALQINDLLSTRLLLARGIGQRELTLNLEIGQKPVTWGAQEDSGHTRRFAVSPDRSLYALADSSHGNVNIYDTNDGQLQMRLELPEVEQLIFTPDNKHVVARVGGEGIHHQLSIFDLENGLQVGSIRRANVDVNAFYQDANTSMPVREELRRVYNSICMGLNSGWFAFADLADPEAGCRPILKLWDFRSGKLQKTPADCLTYPLVAVTVSPLSSPHHGGGRTLFAIDCNHFCHRWRLPAFEHLDPFPWSMWFAQFNPNGKQHLSQEGGYAELMDRRANTIMRSFIRIEATGFSPNGERLVTKQWPDPCDTDVLHEDCTTCLWDTETARLVAQLPYLDVTNWHFTPNSKYLITEHANGQLRVWWSDHGTLVFQTPATRSLRCVDISHDGLALLTRETNRPERMQLWALSSGDSCELTVPEADVCNISQELSHAELDVVFAYSHVSPREAIRFNTEATCLITPTGLAPISMKTLLVGQLKSFVEASVPLRLETGRIRHAAPKEVLSSRLEYYRLEGERADQNTTDVSLDLVVHCIGAGELHEARQIIGDLQNGLSANDRENRQRVQKGIRELSKAYFSRGTVAERQGRYGAAIADLQVAIALHRDGSRALCALAWLQATCAERDVRQPQQALENAERACILTNWGHWECLSTYAVALAAKGQFSKAVQWQEKALRLLPVGEQARWQENFERRLTLFQQESPYEQSYFWNLPTRDLVGWWKFDEDDGRVARDASGDNHDGRLLGNVQWDTDSSRGALRFGGDEGYVNCGVHPMFDITGAITVAAWVKAVGISKLQWASVIASKGVAWEFRREHKTGTLEFPCEGVFSSTPRVDFGGIGGDSPVPAGRWHHVAAVFDGSKLYLYLNGRQDKVELISGEMRIRPEEAFRIGDGQEGTCWKGLIDDVRVYERALSAEEVACLYEETKQ